MESSSLHWGCCVLGKDSDEFIKCCHCSKVFHRDCIIDVVDDSESDGWSCPLCRSLKPRRGNNDETAISKKPQNAKQPSKRNPKRPARASPEPASAIPSPSNEDIRNIIRTEVRNLLPELTKSMTVVNTELKSIRDEIQSFKDSLDFMNRQYEDIIKEQKRNAEMMNILKDNNLQLTKTVQELTVRLSDLEQKSRENNIEIQCVPENKSENLIKTITTIAGVVGCTITEDDIVNCTRVAKVNPTTTRPRSIIVQLSSIKHRNNFLAATIKYNKHHNDNKLNTSHIGLTGTKRPIYVTEHLSPANKQLHASARLKAKELNYKFVWVRGGRVFMRKDIDTQFIFVKNMETLNRLVSS